MQETPQAICYKLVEFLINVTIALFLATARFIPPISVFSTTKLPFSLQMLTTLLQLFT
jgi:hypothetical protein